MILHNEVKITLQCNVNCTYGMMSHNLLSHFNNFYDVSQEVYIKSYTKQL